MKKIILLIGLFTLTVSLNAQDLDKTLGIRFGDNDGLGFEISYQKYLGEINRLETGVALRNNNDISKFKVSSVFQWIWDLEAIANMNWYAGAGAGLGIWGLNDDYKGNVKGGTFLFVAGNVGTEYKFDDFPLLLSLDFRPEFGFSSRTNGLDFDIALGVRYIFD